MSSSLHQTAFQWEKVPLALINWPSQTLVDCNRSFCETLGLTDCPAAGQSLETVLGGPIPFAAPTIAPGQDDLPAPQILEIDYQRGETPAIALALEFTPFRQLDQIYGILRLHDLTEQNKSEASRQAAQERTRAQDDALIEIASDESIHRGDLDEALRSLTSRAAQVLGIDRVSVWQLDSNQNVLVCLCLYDTQLPDFAAGQTLSAAECPHYFKQWKNSRQLTLEKAQEDPRTRELVAGYLQAHNLKSMLITSIRLGEKQIGLLSCEHRKTIRSWQPSEQAFVAALSDLAALALSVQQHRTLELQLRHMMKMESVGRLAGGVAHDFNNIIQAISGYIMVLLEDREVSESARVFLGEMKTATEMAMKLTRKLLAMSRKQPMKLENVSLNKIARDLSGMLSKLIPKESELVLTLEPNLQETRMDASLIEQVIINLVVNARDAIPRKGGRVTFTTRSQSISASGPLSTPEARPGNYVVFSVADNGSGMDESTLAKLFEPFFTTKVEGKGTGLGLSIVYGIVKQHQGWIEVRSKRGLGTTFEVFLPAILL
jgi:signal transduction histidine kinase